MQRSVQPRRIIIHAKSTWSSELDALGNISGLPCRDTREECGFRPSKSQSLIRHPQHSCRSHCLSSMKISLAVAALATTTLASESSRCHCLPGDSCWPSVSAWDSLNGTVGGRLIATVPIGSPCHAPTYDAKLCSTVRSNWTHPAAQYVSSLVDRCKFCRIVLTEVSLAWTRRPRSCKPTLPTKAATHLPQRLGRVAWAITLTTPSRSRLVTMSSLQFGSRRRTTFAS